MCAFALAVTAACSLVTNLDGFAEGFPFVNPHFDVGAWCRGDTVDMTVDDVAVFLTP